MGSLRTAPAFKAVIRFTLDGAGCRRVTLSCGCNRPRSLDQGIANEHVPLLDGEDGLMHYGKHEVIVDGPEAFLLATDGDDALTEMVLDNLDIHVVGAGVDPRR
ncbi:hypothetical protein ORG27_00205 [Stenotrophomonas lactitubi]|uniref:hypothetical protein n=1 Tax=Stenotrophomonas lactitubi TaxID=2045214 RepID=UPI002248AC53|nr:hypothetical protein [Stenotrophomonas lactitubi]MCX2891997.1 hypothetical protein [Stenotrophomonas lactitubi]